MKVFVLTCRLVFLAILLSAVFPSVIAQPPTHTAKFSPTLDPNINGFWEYLPRNYATDLSVSYPLIIYIHGAGDMGSALNLSTLSRVKRNGIAKIIDNGTFPDS